MAKACQVFGKREGLTQEPNWSLEYLQIFPGIDVKVFKEQKASRADITYICVHKTEWMAVCLSLKTCAKDWLEVGKES